MSRIHRDPQGHGVSRNLRFRRAASSIAALAMTFALSAGLLLFAEGGRRPPAAQTRPGASPVDLSGVWL